MCHLVEETNVLNGQFMLLEGGRQRVDTHICSFECIFVILCVTFAPEFEQVCTCVTVSVCASLGVYGHTSVQKA